jgi:hypothetical protein
VSVRLFKTTAGRFVIAVAVFNWSDERWAARDGLVRDSLESLARETCGDRICFRTTMRIAFSTLAFPDKTLAEAVSLVVPGLYRN